MAAAAADRTVDAAAAGAVAAPGPTVRVAIDGVERVVPAALTRTEVAALCREHALPVSECARLAAALAGSGAAADADEPAPPIAAVEPAAETPPPAATVPEGIDYSRRVGPTLEVTVRGGASLRVSRYAGESVSDAVARSCGTLALDADRCAELGREFALLHDGEAGAGAHKQREKTWKRWWSPMATKAAVSVMFLAVLHMNHRHDDGDDA